jgi:hypothetical protein
LWRGRDGPEGVPRAQGLRRQVFLVIAGAALDALDVDAVDITFEREVSPAPFAGPGTYDTKHGSFRPFQMYKQSVIFLIIGATGWLLNLVSPDFSTPAPVYVVVVDTHDFPT